MSDSCVDLGFLEEPSDPWRLHRCYFPSKVGGKPAWLDPKNLPCVENLKCENCSKPLIFLLQVYAPDDALDHCFHRSIFVFCCKNGECYHEKDNRCLKAFLCSLPRQNNFYPVDPPDYETGDAARDCCEPPALCNLCGCIGPKTCSKCKLVHYCGRDHQIIDWKLHKQFCGKKPETNDDVITAQNYLFKEGEIVIESEEQFSKEDDQTGYLTSPDILVCSANEDNAKFTEAELNEAVGIKEEDKTFSKFKKRISSFPDQILRYGRGEKTLWCSNNFVPQEEDIPLCGCGSKRTFEFQIMPQLLTFLQCDTSIQGPTIDWGTVAVYTCAENCMPANPLSPYIPCFTWKQNYSAEQRSDAD